MTKMPGIDPLAAALDRVAIAAVDMNRARRRAEVELQTVRRFAIGRKIFCNMLARQKKGDYKITDVDIDFEGTIRAHGIKILANGKLGSQRWDIGRVDLRKATEIKP